MDGNAADQRPRVPQLLRGANVRGSIYLLLLASSLVITADGLFGSSGATWALGVVFLISSLAILVLRDRGFISFLRRPGTAAAGGMDAGAISALPAVFEFTRDLQTGEESAPCSICLEKVVERDEVRRLPTCGHLFHAGCMDDWLRKRPTCPLCRAEINAAGRLSERLLPV